MTDEEYRQAMTTLMSEMLVRMTSLESSVREAVRALRMVAAERGRDD